KHDGTQGLLLGSKTKKEETGNGLTMAHYFDHKSRVVQAFEQNCFGHTERSDFAYLFSGETAKLHKVHKLTNGTALTETDSSLYDHAGRLSEIYFKLDNAAYQKTVKYEYDEIGRLKKKTLMPDGN